MELTQTLSPTYRLLWLGAKPVWASFIFVGLGLIQVFWRKPRIKEDSQALMIWWLS